jgi:hypothetical protein
MHLVGAVTPIFNIVGGATGRLALFVTHSSGALVVAGVVAVGMGVYQLWRRSAR